MTAQRLHTILNFIFALAFVACSKSNQNSSQTPGPGTGTIPDNLNYGDTVLYLSAQSQDYIVYPKTLDAGRYSAYPEGIDLDQNTGAINVSKSETGLKYHVSFIPAGSKDSVSINIIISGINFLDGFYKLTTADSIAHPLYNAKAGNPMPGIGNGSQFDQGGSCNNNGCTVDITNGQINLAQTVRNGVFGAVPANNDRHEFDLNYSINDNSHNARNTIRVKLYYFETMNDVTQEVYDIITSREGTIIDSYFPMLASFSVTASNSRTSTLGVSTKSASPRPPCIFIVSR
jgi:hypothetical protein